MTFRTVAGAALAAMAVVLPAQAQPRAAGPTVRALAALPPGARELLVGDTVAGRVAAITRDADGVPVAHVLVRLRTADPGPLLRMGARLGTRMGTLMSARVPLEALQALLADGAVAAVYGARRWVPLNDVGTAAVGVASLRRVLSADVFSGPVGRGVIVGLVDTGLDFTHRDFIVDSLGRSRVLYLWDQTLTGTGPGLVGGTSFGYGIECRQEDLSTAGCPSRETIGHGTHVLGTAAGDGSATNGVFPEGQFAGVAPGADLIVVKTTFLSDAVVDGVNYIFSRAAQLGRPAVVNLSLGSQWGPHDGTLPEEELLDSLVGPGRIVVAAAGNDGDNRNAAGAPGTYRRHAMAAVPTPGGASVDFTVAVPGYQPLLGPNNDFIVLQLWYAASDTVSVTVLRPDGSSVSGGATGSQPVTQDGTQGQVFIENGPSTGVALTADHLAFIVLGDFNGGTDPASGSWIVRVTGVAASSGRPMHLWVADGSLGALGGFSAVALTSHSTNGFLVGSPASTTRVLAAGAFVTRVQWQNVNGGPGGYLYPEKVGDLAIFSSSGPRRDGVQKPDITAPGKGIASALSQFYTAASPARTMRDGVHFIEEGTSMAAPFVTCAVALMLERQPALTPEDARARLVAAASVDAFAQHPFDGGTNGVPNASWGYGKLNVAAALGSLVQLAALKPGQANDAIAGRSVPSGEFRVLHLLVVGAPDLVTVLDSLALRSAGSADAGATLAGLKVYRDAGKTGVVPAMGVPAAVSALSGASPRVMLRVGPDTLLPRDTVSLVVTTQLAQGAEIPSGRTVRFDVASDSDLFLRYRGLRAGMPVPVAVQGLPFRGPVVTLQAPGTLTIQALPLGNAGAPQSSGPNMRFPVLRAELKASAEEPFVVQEIGLKAAGRDPSVTLRVILDLNHNGVVDPGEPVLAHTTAALGRDSVLVAFNPTDLVVPAGSSVQLLMDVLTSGAAPNGASFGGAIDTSQVRTRSLYSGLAGRQLAMGSLSSGSVTTSLLGVGEAINISENPVRGKTVVVNFAGTPRRVAIYSFSGERLRDFPAPAGGSVTWDLTTDGGRPVVNGVYIVVIDLGDSVVRRRLYVARRGP